MRIIIDPRVEYRYSSFYRLGLYRLFGSRNISYSVGPFLDLECNTNEQFGAGMQFILVEDNGTEHKVFLDIKDVATIEADKYEWADVYGKVNVAPGETSKYPKLIVTGPEFGLRNRSAIGLGWFGLKNYLKGCRRSDVPLSRYVQTYVYPYIRRRSLKAYERAAAVRPNYVFHASTLWYNEFASTDTNMYRGEFLKACKQAGLEIEGGLFYVEGEAPLKEMPTYPKYKELYKDFIYNHRLSMDAYIEKTKQSVVVFNTPSVCECHGWKLAEYLCMGKAIISTPLKREMPGEGLIHGKNVHFVSSPEEIYQAVVEINQNRAYREQLEQGARAYYEQWLAPQTAVQRVIEQLGIEVKQNLSV